MHQILDGLPYLLNLALYNLAIDKISLEKLLKEIATESSIFSNHLRSLLVTLNKHPELKQAYKQLVNSDTPLQFDPLTTYELDSMSLVKIQGNKVTPRCDLYRSYFRDRL